MRNRATQRNGRMHRTIVGDKVPRLCHPLGVKCIPNYLHLHSDASKDLWVWVTLVGGNRTTVLLDRLALALTDTMEREDGTLPECHYHALHRG